MIRINLRGAELSKKELRQTIITKLKELESKDKAAIECRLNDHLFNSDLWKSINSIGVTLSRGFEWETRPIIEQAWKEGKTVHVPKCYPDEHKLVFYELHSYDQLEVVFYGLQEPKPEEKYKINKKDIELLLVPGIVFNKQGFRIGFGGGYYDRFLSDFPNNTASLISEMQLVDNLPVENHDISVQNIITENGFIIENKGKYNL